MPKSMTGFARQEVKQAWGSISCEIRSVNHRYLEPFFRLPESLRNIETELRQRLKSTIHRGKLEVTCILSTEHDLGSKLVINQTLAAELVALSETVTAGAKNVAPLNPIDILNWPGVLQQHEIDPKDIEQAALSAFSDALTALVEHRQREGAQLKSIIEQRLDAIAGHIHTLRSILPDIMANQENKLRERFTKLQLEIDEERIAQEIVLLAQKADVAEEIDRLDTHIKEVRRTLLSSEAIGRRLDFLMQELNREANTLSSKSIASDTTQNAVELKVLIEQMREQIQNIE